MALNFGSGLAGAGTGAAYGAQFGGPIGGIAGGVVGGALGLFNKKKRKKISTMDSYQQKLHQAEYDALYGGTGPLADVYGQFDYGQARQNFDQYYGEPAYQNYEENMVPKITGAFRGKNLQNSSYLGGALAKGATDVQNSLNREGANYLYNQQQANLDRRAQGLGNYQNRSTFAYEQPQSSSIDELLNTLGPGAANMSADYLTRNYSNRGAPNLNGSSGRLGFQGAYARPGAY